MQQKLKSCIYHKYLAESNWLQLQRDRLKKGVEWRFTPYKIQKARVTRLWVGVAYVTRGLQGPI
ncbi:hypothetical protein SAMN05421640_1456 [Ekhidna lutea]|uniref:Uncharacterized protein n=1 Tax=Ekhidna lutea TaxID=447679 RepID=A0A239HRL5_EKHLU|nr:hypothetical protein SAMN05421640_1456 [Ekhidna lutea]